MMAGKEYQKPGYVYVLSNPSMPGAVKIGRSKAGGKSRAQQMYTTGVPTPFVLEFEILVSNAEEVEVAVHEHLQGFRVNGSREFFACEVQDAIVAVMTEYAGYVGQSVAPGETVWDDGDLNWLTHLLKREKGVDAHPFEVHQAITMEMTVDVAAALWEKHQERMKNRKSREILFSNLRETSTIQ